MKKAVFLVALFSIFSVQLSAYAQQVYWVFLADKAGTTFDPYSYFDAKAIERYRACGADLYDISNYPLQQQYVDGVNAIATAEVGCSRWFNAMGVKATPEQAARIAKLPYVLRVQPIMADMQLASVPNDNDGLLDYDTVPGPLEAQLVRMGGKHFRDAGIDGKGIRIAVFDGGFPRVNTHDAFKHLRDEGRIVKTWNFCNNKENVYGWNSHGTMTLSCIAGRIGGKDLGLATGAEFLLARTEVETEPFQEEVWWQMAVEWADRNGANIISSSLGYGKERHYTKDMDGTSYVAKAGNLAARKGMLVCNSAGNEADDKQWMTIITPSDADSVLCVGGIENSLKEYNHISFSSFGPSADGRQKPNVCAFGYARTADITDDHATHYVHGTSFSCPLVAGFAACAWQASPGKTAMEMFHALEQSADLYPYADYAFGYGVPQAAYFTQNGKRVAPTFSFAFDADSVRIVPAKPVKHTYLFYSFRRPCDKRLEYYGKVKVDYADAEGCVAFSKAAIFDRTLTVHLDGYTDSLTLDEAEYSKYQDASGFSFAPEVSDNAVSTEITGLNGDLDISSWGSNAKNRHDIYFMLGLPVKFMDEELPFDGWSPITHLGFRLMHAYGKSYCVGLGFEWARSDYNFRNLKSNKLDYLVGMNGVEDNLQTVSHRRVEVDEFSIELFQRIRFVAGGLAGKGIHWDLGIYGSYANLAYDLRGSTKNDAVSYRIHTELLDPKALSAYKWNCGLTTRFTYDFVGLYARYRLTGIGDKVADDKALLPRLEVGLQLCF